MGEGVVLVVDTLSTIILVGGSITEALALDNGLDC